LAQVSVVGGNNHNQYSQNHTVDEQQVFGSPCVLHFPTHNAITPPYWGEAYHLLFGDAKDQ